MSQSFKELHSSFSSREDRIKLIRAGNVAEIKNSDLPYFEKLELLSQFSGWSPKSYVQHPLQERVNAWAAKVKEDLQLPKDTYCRAEDVFPVERGDWVERHQLVDLYDMMETAYGGTEGEEEICIGRFTAKTYGASPQSYMLELSLPFDDLAKELYEWAIDNQCISFYYDW
jgi:hypothetical protein